jgi:integrase
MSKADFSSKTNNNVWTSYPAYRNFINSLSAKYTKRNYTHSFSKYYLSRPENQRLSLDEILQKNVKIIEAEIIETIIYMKDTLDLSFSTINTFTASVFHFFEINDVILNKRKINKFKGEYVTKFEFRSYSIEEISNLLSVCDERGKVAVLLMASTGMRVGALPDIKLKHLKRVNVDNQGTYVYQITVYANSPKDKYTTFCTPECAKIIDNYFELRKRYGENIKQDVKTGNWLPPEIPLLIKTFNKEKCQIRPIKIQSDSITKYIVFKLEESGLRKRQHITETNKEARNSKVAKFKNELHPCHSLRIFAVTNMQRSKIDTTIREMLVGHSTGLDKAYYKPQDDEILTEYLKAVDSLTINNEYRLEKKLGEYKQKSEGVDEIRQQLEQKYEKNMSNLQENIEKRIEELLQKVDVQKLR